MEQHRYEAWEGSDSSILGSCECRGSYHPHDIDDAYGYEVVIRSRSQYEYADLLRTTPHHATL